LEHYIVSSRLFDSLGEFNYLTMFQFHEKWKNPKTGRYKKHIYTLNDKPLMGITSVLSVIAKPALIGWAARKAVEYIAENLDEEGVFFPDVDWKATLEEAKCAHSDIAEEAAGRGTEIHKGIESYINLMISDQDGQAMQMNGEKDKAVQKFIDWAFANKIKFLESEKRMYSEKMWTAGTVDLVFEKDGKRYIGDIKTYAKIWDRVPFFQMAGYALMLEEMGEKIDGSCIINITKDTNELTEKWSYNMTEDKKSFLAALQIYNTKDYE
jgi:CRISPR/Cas system-associated exonuclease Cas4 (RecB family)